MPTLQNIQGSSLVSDPTRFTTGAAQGYGLGQKIAENRERTAMQARLKDLGAGALSGDIDSLNQLALIEPEIASAIVGIHQSRNQAAADKLTAMNDRMGSLAASVIDAPPPVQRQLMLIEQQKLREEGAVGQADELLRMAGMAGNDPDALNAELRRDMLSSDITSKLMGKFKVDKPESKVVNKQLLERQPNGEWKVVGGATRSGQGEQIPASLVKNLQPDLAASASDAFMAAGGGKDGMKAFQDVVAVDKEERKQTVKANVLRIRDLSQTSRERSSSVAKAQTFLDAFERGEAGSGTSRTALSFIPGVYSSQGAFDQKFNAFAEVAARQKLKASGETRPTDADVEGMKRAMFGVGRDEEVNIQLLKEFISDQQSLDSELSELQQAKKERRLHTFTGGEQDKGPVEVTSQAAYNAMPSGTVYLEDGVEYRKP